VQDMPTTSTSAGASQDPSKAHAQRLSALELAAQRGIGPLSPQGLKAWHGESYPCVSCGELVRRSAIVCEQCGQDLSLKMIIKMQAHAGPWYVHEHVRPFPGVTLERLVRQAQRGVLTATTIVRGPTTHHQWRFAAETPALSKHLGLCWNCQARVNPVDQACAACRVNLDQPAGEQSGPPSVETLAAAPIASRPPAPPPAPLSNTTAAPLRSVAASVPGSANRGEELERIRAALEAAQGQAPTTRRRLPMGLIIAAILIVAIAGLAGVIKLRQKSQVRAPQAAPTPAASISPGQAGE